MNDIFIILILVILAATALYSCLRRNKGGCGGNCGDCGGCSGGCGSGCGRCDDNKKPEHHQPRQD